MAQGHIIQTQSTADRALDALVGREGVAIYTVRGPDGGKPDHAWSASAKLAWDGGSPAEMVAMFAEAMVTLTGAINQACDDLAQHMKISPEAVRRRLDETYHRRMGEVSVDVRKVVMNGAAPPINGSAT